MSMMWKSGQTPLAVPQPAPEPIRFESSTPANEYGGRICAVPSAADQASIGKGMVFKGAITGSGSLFVDGEVVGNINLPESRVTVGPTGHVSDGLSVCISAREIVVIGKIRGNISASDRVEICAEGALTGNVSAARISIADGAYFKGDIDLRTVQPKQAISLVREEDEQRQAYA
jgi:cytoskeletal protein CcmA (bactofilin family)